MNEKYKKSAMFLKQFTNGNNASKINLEQKRDQYRSFQKSGQKNQSDYLDFYNKYRKLQIDYFSLKDKYIMIEDQNKTLQSDLIKQTVNKFKKRKKLKNLEQIKMIFLISKIVYKKIQIKLIKNLKITIQQLKLQNENLDQQLKEFQLQQNTQRVFQIESENLQLIQENYKLKGLLELNEQNPNLQLLQQLDQYKLTQKQNQELTLDFQESQKKNEKLNQIIQKLKIKLKNQENNYKKSQEILHNISFNVEKIQLHKLVTQKQDIIKNQNQKISDLDNEVFDLQTRITQKECLIQDQYMQLRKVDQLEDFINNQKSEIETLKQQNLNLKQDLFSINQQLEIEQESLQQIQNQRKLKVVNDLSENIKSQFIDKFLQVKDKKDDQKKKLIDVNYFQIQDQIFQIRYKLINKQIQFDDIDYYLINNAQNTITIKQLMYNLSLPPFEVKNEQDQELIARYLCEQQQQQKSNFINIMMSQAISVVISIFKCLIKKFTIFTGQQKIEKFQKIAQKFLEEKQEINMYIYPKSYKIGIKKPYCHLNHLLESIQLSQELKDVLISYIFNQTQGFDSFNMDELWLCFKSIQEDHNNQRFYYYQYLVTDFDRTQIQQIKPLNQKKQSQPFIDESQNLKNNDCNRSRSQGF